MYEEKHTKSTEAAYALAFAWRSNAAAYAGVVPQYSLELSLRHARRAISQPANADSSTLALDGHKEIDRTLELLADHPFLTLRTVRFPKATRTAPVIPDFAVSKPPAMPVAPSAITCWTPHPKRRFGSTLAEDRNE